MKKLALVFVFAFATTLFNSCTPQSADDAGNDLIEYGTDKGELGSPGSQGGDPDEDDND